MGQITTLFVHKVLGIASKAVDKSDVLRSVGISPDSPVDPKQMISDVEYYNFLERLAREDGDGTTLPLRAGASMRCDDYGALGLAMKSALTLRGTYDRAERYGRVLTNVAAYPVEKNEDGAFIHLYREGERRLGMRLSNEATIASITTI
ncbi:MAG: AraC family transcriptional regulator ligand-binding domain-containing protein, partial [Calditrichota bacterium]